MESEEKEIKLRQTGIKVKLIGTDGNAFALLGKVGQALRENGESKEFIDAFLKEAMSKDYDHLLCTIASVVEIE